MPISERVSLKKELQKQAEALQEYDIICHYRDSQFTYVLQFCHEKYCWYKKAGSIKDFCEKTFQKLKKFDSLKEFWNQFTADKNWFQNYEHHNFHPILVGFIGVTHNKLVRELELSVSEYKSLYKWIKACYFKMPTSSRAFAQSCGNCRTLIRFSPRYPKAICSQCYRLELTDEHNIPIAFYNDSHNTFKVQYYN